MRLEHLHLLSRDHCATHTTDELLALPAEHHATDYFHPARLRAGEESVGTHRSSLGLRGRAPSGRGRRSPPRSPPNDRPPPPPSRRGPPRPGGPPREGRSPPRAGRSLRCGRSPGSMSARTITRRPPIVLPLTLSITC